MHINVESLFCTPETIILCHYTSININKAQLLKDISFFDKILTVRAAYHTNGTIPPESKWTI